MCHYQLGDKQKAQQLLDLLAATKDAPDLQAHLKSERDGFRTEAAALINQAP